MRKSKAAADIPKISISDSKKNLVKGGKQKRPATKRKASAVAATVDAALAQPVARAPAVATATALNQRVQKQNVLGDISNNLFTPSNDEDEEFRLTVETAGKKRHMSVFKDAVEDSPGETLFIIVYIIKADRNKGRTESPLEDHRYDSFSFIYVLEGDTMINMS